MHRTRVGVLRGGPSHEYDVSLNTGASILQHLPNDIYEGKDILIDREGIWHLRGMPMQPERVLQQVDVIVNGLHGAYGEDGTVQKLLTTHGIPYTGSDALGSGIAMNKVLTKKQAAAAGLQTAQHYVLDVDSIESVNLAEAFRSMSPPFVVKPVDSGSSVGVAVAKTFPQFQTAIETGFAHSNKLLVEEFVFGREATCGVVEGLRDQALYILPPIEIIPPKEAGFFNNTVKYNGETLEICPGNFSTEEKAAIGDAARIIHEQLGLRHYSRSDFIVSRRGVYFLEVNTLPGLTKESLLPKALRAVGVTFPDFLDHLIRLALAGK